MKKTALILLIFLLTNFAFSQKKTKQIDNFFTALFQEGAFNGNVLIAEKGKVIYEKSFGVADEKNKKKLTSKSVFNLASVSKQFTAMGIVLLEKDGKLSYDDKMSKYIPELEFYGDVTIRNLLLHTGGIPDYMALMEKHWDKDKIATNSDVIAQFAKHKPTEEFKAGTKFKYSNTGYVLLASIIEKVSGKTYADFLDKKIFKPLNMTNTNVYKIYQNPVDNKKIAFGYIQFDTPEKIKPEKSGEDRFVVYLDGVIGQGRVFSTARDLLIWDRALYSDKLVSKKDKELIFNAGKIKGKSFDGTETEYGFGWYVDNEGDYGKRVSHSGRWAGYITYFDRHLDNDKTIIILQNNETSKTRLPLKDIQKILYNIPIEKEFDVSLDTLKKYAGGYKYKSDKTRKIFLENNKLFVQIGKLHFRLIALSKTKFRMEGFLPEITIEFLLNDKGEVEKYRELQPETGVDAEYIRIK